MEMGVSQGFGANGEMVGWAQGKVAVGMTGLARRNGSGSRNGSCRAWGGLTRRGSVVVTSQLGLESSNPPELTIQATGTAQPGMFSLQKPRTSVRAVISKGINSAS